MDKSEMMTLQVVLEPTSPLLRPFVGLQKAIMFFGKLFELL